MITWMCVQYVDRESASDWHMRGDCGVQLLCVAAARVPPGTGEGWDETDEITASIHVEPAKLVLTSFLNTGVFFCSVYMHQFILAVFVLSVSDAGPDGRTGAQLLLRVTTSCCVLSQSLPDLIYSE